MLTHLPRIRGYRLCIGPSSLPTEHVFCLISFLSWLLSVYRSPSSSNPAETVFFMDRLLFPWRRRPGPEQPGCRWRCRRRPGTRRPESSSCVKCPPAALTSSVFPTFSAWGFSLAGLANRTGRGQNQFTLAKSPVSAGAEHRERALLTQRSAGILGGSAQLTLGVQNLAFATLGIVLSLLNSVSAVKGTVTSALKRWEGQGFSTH